MITRMSGVDPRWSVRGGIEAKIGRKGPNFARFWPILEGAVPPRPLLDPPSGADPRWPLRGGR